MLKSKMKSKTLALIVTMTVASGISYGENTVSQETLNSLELMSINYSNIEIEDITHIPDIFDRSKYGMGPEVTLTLDKPEIEEIKPEIKPEVKEVKPEVKEVKPEVKEVKPGVKPAPAVKKVPAQPIANYTEQDLMLLAGVISAEARGESHEGMLAVGTVVMNRVAYEGSFGKTIREVIYEPNQFATKCKTFRNPSPEVVQAAREVLEGHRSFNDKVLGFYAPGSIRPGHPMTRWSTHTNIGGHRFVYIPGK